MWNFSGSKKIGIQPSANFAVAFTDWPIRLAQKIGTLSRTGMVDELERLAQPGSLALGQRHLHRRTVVDTFSRFSVMRQTLM